jgi:cytochrome c-type biogenesis protein CcmF
MPWFTATAFLHSAIIQEQRGMFKGWNLWLVTITFFLTIFGTFMTRSGVVQSVHAFGEDRELAWLFGGFMVALLTFSFGWVIYRLPLLRSRNELDSWASREAAFILNNWILLFSAFFVLFGTMFPTLSEAVTGQRITVAEPFYNRWMTPIGLVLLLLTGVGPLLAWRKSSVENLRYQFLWPTVTALATLTGILLLGVRIWSSGICFVFAGFVLGTIGQEFWHGAIVRRRSTGTDIVTALIGLVTRSHRRYGGYIVHLGIVLIFLGFAGEGFKQEEQVVLKPGQSVNVGHFTVRHDALRLTDDGQKQMVTAHLAIERSGKATGTMLPGKWFFRKHEEEPTTEVAIRRSVAEDLYIVLAGFDVQTQSATLHVVVNPLVNWIWVGFVILALGTFIALLPERAFTFALGRVPSGAATTTTLLLVLLFAASVHAQHTEGVSNAFLVARSPFERELQKEIICMCGTCGRKRLHECTCPKAAEMRGEVARLVGEGKTREQVYEYFMARYGSQEPLASPIDKGFNRLAWAVPYLVGLAGAATFGTLAIRWSRSRPAPSAGDVPPGTDPELEQRLADELRSLD